MKQTDPNAQLSEWERAYAAFETPEEEIAKFTRRLRRMGAPSWSRDARIVELFCGRGNGLHALERMGFRNLEGIDLSPRLLGLYSGSATCVLGDCRSLPYEDASRDVLVVQGGLHHLERLPEDLSQTLREARRVLRPDGRLIVVEPWLTPFLSFMHAVASVRLARRLSKKIDAFATMNENERTTYERWLGSPELISSCLREYFSITTERTRWAKLMLEGKPRKKI